MATFNVSMEGHNYVQPGATPSGQELPVALSNGEHPQIRNIAEIIQRVRPDIVLLNEFDYHPDSRRALQPFVDRYLKRRQSGREPIDFPHVYQGPVNTGVDSGVVLHRHSEPSGSGQNAFGYGLYPGQYGMLLLSRFPIARESIRSFQTFLWKDMPGNLMQDMRDEHGELWYPAAAREKLRLSSKSHWDIPIRIGAEVLHVLASHPTPPVFDGPEDRNGRRNHDEIRFWVDFLGDESDSAYIYDDAGQRGGLRGQRFVLLGDLNASIDEGDARREGIAALLGHHRVRRGPLPRSDGGRANRADSPFSSAHTAAWGLRVDYVLPSTAGWRAVDAGVFWPTPQHPLHRLVKDRRASSDHRLVWMDLELTPLTPK